MARPQTRPHDSETRNQAVARRLAEIVAQRDWTLVQTGRSLHDDLGQVLTAAGIRFDLMSNECASRYPEISSQLGELQSLLEECQARVRVLSSQMNRATVDRIGLKSALERVRDRWEPAFAGFLSVHCPASVRPVASASRAIVDVAQHAMELACNRLSCTAARIEVQGGDRWTSVEIFLENLVDPFVEIEDEVRWYIARGACHLAGGDARIEIAAGGRNGTILRAHFGAVPGKA
jgi:signal transduction histidine kinase